jgi:hypothetical protein
MRTRNPWVRLRRVTDGWYVLFMIDLGKAKYFPLWRPKGQPKLCSYWVFPLFNLLVFSLFVDLYGVFLFGHNLSTGFPPA